MHSNAATEAPRAPMHLLREDRVILPGRGPTYEDEGTDQVARGAVTLPGGGRWCATLEVRLRATSEALLTVQRVGAGVGSAPSEACLVVPLGEEEALLTLLLGLFAQAGTHGLLGAPVAVKARRRVRPPPTEPDAGPSD